MQETQQTFVNMAGLARALFMDNRTLRSRLSALGISPDAQFLESGGVSPLFSVTRIPQIREQVGAIVELYGISCGITTPISK